MVGYIAHDIVTLRPLYEMGPCLLRSAYAIVSGIKKAMSENIDGGWAWVVLACGVGTMFIDGFVGYSLGVINSAMLEVFDGDVSWTSTVVVTELATLNFVGPLAGFCINRSECRTCAVLGGIISTIGLTGASFSKDLPSVMITLGILTGFGQGFCYVAAIVKVGHNFRRLLPLATGITMAGAGIGMLVGPPVVQILIDHYGLRGSFLIMAAISSHLCVFGSLLRPLPVCHLEDEKPKQTSKKFKRRQLKCFERLMELYSSSQHIFRNLGFMMYLWSTFCWSLAESACFLHLPTYCIQQGSTKQQTSFLFTVMGIVNICSRILVGFAANDERISKVTILFGQMTVAGVCTGLFPLYSRMFGGQVAYAAVLGIYSSGASSLMTPLAVQIVGLDDLATAFGLISFFFGAGCLAGPSIAGAIVDSGATYREIFIFAGAVYLMSGQSAILIPLVQKKKNDDVINGRDRDLSISQEVVNENPPYMEALIHGTDTNREGNSNGEKESTNVYSLELNPLHR